MENFCYLCTSYTDRETLLDAIKHYQSTDENGIISLPSFGAQIEDGDDYFLAQREGMLNFFSAAMHPDHMEVQSHFIMQLASCMKGYKISCNSYEDITPLLNSLIEATSAVIFTPAMQFYTKDWQLLIDAEGNCDLTEYTAKMSAATFDADVAPTNESEDRKQRSIALIKQNDIPVLESLPVVPDSSQAYYRDDEELATRIIALAATAVKGELKTSDVAFDVLQKFKIQPNDVSPWEAQFLQATAPTDQSFVNAIWRYESLNVLLWAAGYEEELAFPSEIVNVGAMVAHIRDSSNIIEFVATINTRDMSEILDQLDLTYRLHWACVNARINNKELNAVNASVVYERHYALNWLINRYGEDWDAVSTPT